MNATTEIHLRRVRMADRDRLRRMWRDIAQHQAAVDDRLSLARDYLERWEADFEPWLRSPHHRIFVAQTGIDENSLVGFIHARQYEHAPVFDSLPEIFVEAIWVDESARRTGVARRLVQAVVVWAGEVGAPRVRYSVLERDERAVAFWSSAGGNPLLCYGTIDVPESSGGEAAVAGGQSARSRFGFDPG